MDNVTLAEAKEHLEELMERAANGEDVRISDPKVGTVRLSAVREGDPTVPRVTDTMPPFVPLGGPRKPGSDSSMRSSSGRTTKTPAPISTCWITHRGPE